MRFIICLFVIITLNHHLKGQGRKWILSNSQQTSSGSFYTLSTGNLKFYEVDFSGPAPIFATRTLGTSIQSIKSIGSQDVINNGLDSLGNVDFYLFSAALSPFNVSSSPIDTVYFASYNSITGADEVFGKVAAENRISSVIEHGLCRVPNTNNQYYFIYKTKSGSSTLDDVRYVKINSTLKTVSAPINLRTGKSNSEGFAISPLNCQNKNRWLYTAAIAAGGNIELWKYQISDLGVFPPTLAYTVSIPSNAGVTVIAAIEISPDGSTLALCNYNSFSPGKELILLDLDMSTGNLNNERYYVNPTGPIVTCEFSSDGSQIYALQSGSGSFPSKLYHYSVISSGSYTFNSADELSVALNAPLAMERAYNGKIYGIVGPNENYFYIIDNINTPTPTISYTSSSFYGAYRIGDGLPDVAEENANLESISIIGPTSICNGDTALLIVNLSANDTVQWYGSFSSTNDSIYVSPIVNSTYFVTIKNGLCSASDSISIYPIPADIAEFTVALDSCSGKAIFTSTSIAVTYEWNSGNSAYGFGNPFEFNYTASGQFLTSLYINSGSICADSATLMITVPDAAISKNIIPNIFTPNGDGINDYFSSASLCGYNKAIVFDRWGVKMFETDDVLNKFWDGNYINGKPVAEGVYFYIFYSNNKESLKGTVQVSR